MKLAVRVALLAALAMPGPVMSAPSVEERLEKLEQQQQRMEDELRQKDARIRELEAQVAGQARPATAPGTAAAAPDATAPAAAEPGAAAAPVTTAEAAAPVDEEPSVIGGSFEPGKGFVLARGEFGEVDFSAYAYVRYLNQDGLDDTYTDAFGRTTELDLRNDLQFQKAILYLKGWLLDPKLRYVFYTWTANTSQGDSAQVVVAGYLNYLFNPSFNLGLGIGGLPSQRSTQGTWPNWQRVDNRTVADSFFQASYTTGIWAAGALDEGLKYKVMVGNNLSQLGVNAGQLDGTFNTVSGALWWMPTTGEFGPNEGFGDFEEHEEVATLLGVHYTRSRESAQSQPGQDDPENAQIRLSDGTVIFRPDAFGTDGRITKATYQMAALDAGLKYRGFSLDGEYYWRWVDDFSVIGEVPVDDLFDHGFQLQASAMLVPRTLQGYVSGSQVFGEYGDPWDVGLGLNWWPFRQKSLRANAQLLFLDESPVGAYSLPQIVGGDGLVITTDVEFRF